MAVQELHGGDSPEVVRVVRSLQAFLVAIDAQRGRQVSAELADFVSREVRALLLLLLGY